MSKRVEDILDICLDRMTREGWTLEKCLEAYPEYADQLEPLLRAGASLTQASSTEPRPEYKRALRQRVVASIHSKASDGERRNRRLVWQRGWALAIVAVLIVLVGGAGGTVAASSDSLPGDTLYPVKTATERVQGFFMFGDEAKANFYMKIAERRLHEMQVLQSRQRVVPASVVNVMNVETEKAIEVLQKNRQINAGTARRLVGLTSDQREALVGLVKEAPPEARAKLVDALRRSNASHVRAVDIENNAPPSHHIQQVVPSPGNARPRPGPADSLSGNKGNSKCPETDAHR